MSFAKLYDDVQKQDRISTSWLETQAIQYSNIIRIKEQWSSMFDRTTLRGVYIEGPIGPPVPLCENEALIILSREMCKGHLGSHWRRFVKTKEMMHVFDLEEEKAGSAELFDIQIEKFADPSAPVSTQFRAEQKAFWRALAVLCPEEKRLELKADLQREAKSFDVVGAALRIPTFCVRRMVRDDFEKIINGIKNE